MRAYRLLILGAGFSRPAGLPLGAELFEEVRRRIKDDSGHDNHVERDLKRFVEFQQRCFDRVIRLDAVDCEEFLGFLDVEHYLGLKGKDTWSSEGNESQLMIRKAIGQVIHSRTPEPTKIPDVYRRFAGQLTAGDYILTFNYDTLLERTFSLLGIPYRLFPDRYAARSCSCWDYFQATGQTTGFGEKALHRMLSSRGNPTTRNLFAVTKIISKGLGIKPQLKLAA